MSEEKPIYKVTDRRLFNPDGTPRDIERPEEIPAPAPSSAQAAPEPAPSATAGSGPARTSAAAAQPATGGERQSAPQPAAEADDPQDFLMVIEFIASFAAEALGMSAHPEAGGGQAHVNPPLARQCIDMLGALERKTRGNLNAEEKQFLDLILTQLRMQYVQLTRGRPGGGAQPGPARGGFTGGDITGGR